MQVIAAMRSSEGGRSTIAPRLLSRFNTIAFLEPSLPRLSRIYQTLVLHKFSDFKEVRISMLYSVVLLFCVRSACIHIVLLSCCLPQDVRSAAENIAAATVALHQAVRQSFRPKPEKPHYLFSMRDTSKVVHGLYQADHRCIEDRDALLKLWYGLSGEANIG